MNLNNYVVYRRLRLGPLHQLHPGRSGSLIRHHNRLHRSPPCVEFLPVRLPLHPLSLDGSSDRNESIKILASPASMRNAESPCHVSFIGIPSSPGVSYNVLLSPLFDVELSAIFSGQPWQKLRLAEHLSFSQRRQGA